MDVKRKKGVSPRKAAALKYEPSKDRAPRVTARGEGLIAEQIIALARKNHVPINEDPDLVGILTKLDLEEEIPPEAYQVVAEILAFVYSLHKKWEEGSMPGPTP